ncbi:hypothetical protein NQZ68_038601 [Dissostichus eleginoides]|nr:hypothetical protein NQZ68_038601 [Dissostichus eleginoides]
MEHLLLLLSAGLQAKGTLNQTEPVRLVGGSSRCEGGLELRHQGDWRPVVYLNWDWNLKRAEVFCRELDCGSAVSVGRREESSWRLVWGIRPGCLYSGSALRKCAAPRYSRYLLNLTCSGKPISPIMHLTCSGKPISPIMHLTC